MQVSAEDVIAKLNGYIGQLVYEKALQETRADSLETELTEARAELAKLTTS